MEVIFTTNAFGKFPGFVIGLIKSFDYIVGSSELSIGFAYFTYFLHIPSIQSTIVTIATVWPIILMKFNIKGMKEASGANLDLVVLKVTALILFIIVGCDYKWNFNFIDYHSLIRKFSPTCIYIQFGTLLTFIFINLSL